MGIGEDVVEPPRPSFWSRVKASWSSRAGRKEYWLWVAMLTAVGLIPGAGAGTQALWLFVFTRRLHDLDRSGWWSLAPMGVAFAILLVGMAIGVDIPTATLIAGVSSWVFTTWLGCQPGDAMGNRFGPPPPTDWRSLLVGRGKPV